MQTLIEAEYFKLWDLCPLLPPGPVAWWMDRIYPKAVVLNFSYTLKSPGGKMPRGERV